MIFMSFGSLFKLSTIELSHFSLVYDNNFTMRNLSKFPELLPNWILNGQLFNCQLHLLAYTFVTLCSLVILNNRVLCRPRYWTFKCERYTHGACNNLFSAIFSHLLGLCPSWFLTFQQQLHLSKSAHRPLGAGRCVFATRFHFPAHSTSRRRRQLGLQVA